MGCLQRLSISLLDKVSLMLFLFCVACMLYTLVVLSTSDIHNDDDDNNDNDNDDNNNENEENEEENDDTLRNYLMLGYNVMVPQFATVLFMLLYSRSGALVLGGMTSTIVSVGFQLLSAVKQHDVTSVDLLWVPGAGAALGFVAVILAMIVEGRHYSVSAYYQDPDRDPLGMIRSCRVQFRNVTLSCIVVVVEVACFVAEGYAFTWEFQEELKKLVLGLFVLSVVVRGSMIIAILVCLIIYTQNVEKRFTIIHTVRILYMISLCFGVAVNFSMAIFAVPFTDPAPDSVQVGGLMMTDLAVLVFGGGFLVKVRRQLRRINDDDPNGPLGLEDDEYLGLLRKQMANQAKNPASLRNFPQADGYDASDTMKSTGTSATAKQKQKGSTSKANSETSKTSTPDPVGAGATTSTTVASPEEWGDPFRRRADDQYDDDNRSVSSGGGEVYREESALLVEVEERRSLAAASAHEEDPVNEYSHWGNTSATTTTTTTSGTTNPFD